MFGLVSNRNNRIKDSFFTGLLVAAQNPNLARNRLIVVLIAMISIIPFGVAWYLAKHTDMVKDRPKVNYGQLITPALPIDYAELLQTPVTSAENLPEVKGHWIMVQVASGPVCNAACQDTAQKTGRLRLMLNKEISRVRRLLLFAAPAEVAGVQELAGLDPTLLMVGLSDGLRQRLQQAVGEPLTEGGVLLLDPFGNAMMWYKPGFDPYGILRDLQRLLKNSQIG